MLESSVLLFAPFVQLILIIYRIDKKISFSISTITILAMVVAICLAFIVSNYVDRQVNPSIGPHCGVISSSFLIIGILISLTVIPLIGIIGGIIWQQSHKNENGIDINQ